MDPVTRPRRAPMSVTALLVLLLLLLLLLAIVPRVGAQADSARVERLAGLARVWGTVRVFHPHLVHERLNWDSALVQAVGEVGRARDRQDYAAAVQRMLGALGDPVTRLADRPAAATPGGEASVPMVARTADGIMVVTVVNVPSRAVLMSAQLRQVAALLPGLAGVVFDLRAAPLVDDGRSRVAAMLDSSGVTARLSTTPLVSAGERRLEHLGWAPQQGINTGGFQTRWTSLPARRFTPAASGAGDPRVVFVVNERSDLPHIALALQLGGSGLVVADGGASDRSLVRTARVRAADGVEALVRLTELEYWDGAGALRVDSLVPPRRRSEVALGAAVQLVRAPKRSVALPDTSLGAAGARRGASAPDLRERAGAMPARGVSPEAPVDRPFTELRNPDARHRLVAAFRLWSTLRWFYPYAHAGAPDWDRLLRAAIPAFAAARDSLAYGQAVAEMVAALRDGQAMAQSPALAAFLGSAQPPVRTRVIEGRAVVVEVMDDAAAGGVRPGDVVLSVDGEEATARARRHARWVAGSTAHGQAERVSRVWLGGAPGAPVRLTVQGDDGARREVTLPRTAAWSRALERQRGGPVFRLLAPEVGYADLERLTPAMVDTMFDAFRDTKAIVFDARGGALRAAWLLTTRLSARWGDESAQLVIPVVRSPDSTATSTLSKSLPEGDGRPVYAGRTVVLIDERTTGAAERAVMVLEAAVAATLVGTPSAGADGELTTVVLPGDVLVTFPGQEARRAGGRPVHGVGIAPRVEAAPTLAGIRAGRDEALERALALATAAPTR